MLSFRSTGSRLATESKEPGAIAEEQVVDFKELSDFKKERWEAIDLLYDNENMTSGAENFLYKNSIKSVAGLPFLSQWNWWVKEMANEKVDEKLKMKYKGVINFDFCRDFQIYIPAIFSVRRGNCKKKWCLHKYTKFCGLAACFRKLF